MNQQSPRQSVFHQVLSVLSRKALGQVKQPIQLPQRPTPADRGAWCAYWKAQGQPWRTEPEIDKQRQEYLAGRRLILPDIEQGLYPFKDIKLDRADVEWLLATHENGRGPVDWSDEKQRDRIGIDLRGADLRQVNLRGLPLSCSVGGLRWEEWTVATEQQRNLAGVHLEKAILRDAHLEWVRYRGAYLEGANLRDAHLEKAHLFQSHLESVNFFRAHLEGANLRETHLQNADLPLAYFDHTTTLDRATLADKKHGVVSFVDVRWGGMNLSVVDWTSVNMLGNELKARQRRTVDGRIKRFSERLDEYQMAVRANRQLAVVLQDQGLDEVAIRFAYRAQILQKTVFRFQVIDSHTKLKSRLQALGAWLFSWFLYLLAGYGYKPFRSFLAYLCVIVGFATSYYLLGLRDVVGPHHVFGPYHLTWYEAIVVSMTAFHGRGFFANQFQPGDPQASIAALEAFVGLLIEVTFIATLTRRLFGQ